MSQGENQLGQDQPKEQDALRLSASKAFPAKSQSEANMQALTLKRKLIESYFSQQFKRPLDEGIGFEQF